MIFIGFYWFSLSELTLDRRHAYRRAGWPPEGATQPSTQNCTKIQKSAKKVGPWKCVYSSLKVKSAGPCFERRSKNTIGFLVSGRRRYHSVKIRQNPDKQTDTPVVNTDRGELD